MGRLRSSFLGALLLIALAVTGVLTYHAYVSSRQHRAIVERVMRDYVAIASYQISNSTRVALFDCARVWLGEATRGKEGTPIDKLPLTDCGNTGRTRFAIDLQTGLHSVWGGQPPAGMLAWLQDTIPTHELLPLRSDWRLGLLTVKAGPTRELVVFAAEVEDDRPVRAIGFIADSALKAISRDVLAASQWLPPELANGVPDSAFFAVEIGRSQPSGQREFVDLVVLEPEFASLPLSIRLKPAAVDRIVQGGLPDNRAFELLGLMALAAGLVLSSLWLLQREAQLARTRARFVSSVSHELRTPLAQIRMFAEMLLLGRVRNEADQRRSLEVIDKEARRLTQLVENVLQVARSETGGTRVNTAPARLATIVRDTAENFMVLAEASRIELRLELDESLIVPVDSAAVRQIVLNLLDNAVKYGPAGQRIVVGLALFEDVARLWVDDEGPGVPGRERERVFDAFYRARRDMLSSTTGSGIGLAVVRELAVLHNGHAWIENAPDVGARVVVEFPGAYVAEEQAAAGWAVA